MKLDAWLPALHIVGVILWVGGLTAVLGLLHVHPKVDEASRGLLSQLERRVAMFMDLGATLAIGVGLWMALRWHAFKQGGWLHVKLTVVILGVLSVHGIARAKIKKFRNGDVRPIPPPIWILFVAAVAAAAILGSNKLLLRG